MDQDDYNLYIQQLNPHINFDKPRANYSDANWEKLRNESHQPQNLIVKTQTPKVYAHAKHFSFSYRAFDGAAWHTEFRNINIDKPTSGLTSTQALLRDSLQTVFALAHSPVKLKWITPLTKLNQFDPRYQLLLINNTWYCCIDDKFYKQSNARIPHKRTYTEITFSTNIAPVFSQSIVDAVLLSIK